MNSFLNILRWFFPPAVSDHEVRAEVWQLGARHQGEVLQGARAELNAPDLSPRRAALLRAVIRTQAA